MSSMTNPVKTKIKAGGAALGMGVRLSRSPDVARIAKASGHDFIFIDALPKTGVGKFDKKMLRQQFDAYAAQGQKA